jgi:hypothetical protein
MAKFGEDFMGDCVDYPGDPGLENVPLGPEIFCKEGVKAFPDCPMVGAVNSCSGWFVVPDCCSMIRRLCDTL